MQYDKSLVAHKLLRWDKFITDYHLPEWDSIPDFGLYMDQVIVLLEQYEDYSEKFRRLALFFNQQVQSAAEGVRSTEQGSDNAVELLVIESALIAGFSKILAEKLIRLCGADTEDVLAAEQAKEE